MNSRAKTFVKATLAIAFGLAILSSSPAHANDARQVEKSLSIAVACDPTFEQPAKILSGVTLLAIASIVKPDVRQALGIMIDRFKTAQSCEEFTQVNMMMNQIFQKAGANIEEFWQTAEGRKMLTEAKAELRKIVPVHRLL